MMKTNRKLYENLSAYFLLFPDLLLLTMFVFIPVLGSFYLSLHKWNGLSQMIFVGLGNYRRIFRDLAWWHSVGISFLYTLMYVPAVFAVALALALLLRNLKARIQGLFRTLYFVPFAVSGIVASFIWKFLYSPKNGYINQALAFLGVAPQLWLGSTKQALISVVIVSLWMHVGFNMIIFLAGILDIPANYYEAAEIDGARSVTKFFRITFPLLRNTNIFILITSSILSFQVFDQVKAMTNGGPGDATNVSVFHIYRQAFEMFHFGYSASMAFVLFMIILVISLLQLNVLKSSRD